MTPSKSSDVTRVLHAALQCSTFTIDQIVELTGIERSIVESSIDRAGDVVEEVLAAPNLQRRNAPKVFRLRESAREAVVRDSVELAKNLRGTVEDDAAGRVRVTLRAVESSIELATSWSAVDVEAKSWHQRATKQLGLARRLAQLVRERATRRELESRMDELAIEIETAAHAATMDAASRKDATARTGAKAKPGAGASPPARGSQKTATPAIFQERHSRDTSADTAGSAERAVPMSPLLPTAPRSAAIERGPRMKAAASTSRRSALMQPTPQEAAAGAGDVGAATPLASAPPAPIDTSTAAAPEPAAASASVDKRPPAEYALSQNSHTGGLSPLSELLRAPGGARVIRKYPNGRLYDSLDAKYLLVGDLQRLIVDRIDFVVVSKETGEDITRSVLLQIIAEQEERGEPIMTRDFLTLVIRGHDGLLHDVIGGYLDQILRLFVAQQREWRNRDHSISGEGTEAMASLTDGNYDRWRALQDEITAMLKRAPDSGKPDNDAGKAAHAGIKSD